MGDAPTSKDVLFVNAPAHGHVNPTLPVAEELLRRGHRVRYATGAELLPSVRAAGAEAVEVPLRMPRPPRFDKDFDPGAMQPHFEQMLSDMRAALPVLEEEVERARPDAVLADAVAPIGRILTDKHGLDHVATVPNLASNEQFSLRDEMNAHWKAGFDPYHPVMVGFVQQVEDFAAEHGVRMAAAGMMSAEPAPLNLVFVPREFQLAVDTFDERFAFVGPSLAGREDRERWEPADDRPVLFISLGTVFHERPEFYRTCLEAFDGTDWQVAMSVGSAVDPADLGQLPENFEVRSRFPQTAVLRRASAFLSHSGMNSTMESLYYGVPLIGVPQMPEQEVNARRAEELGVGRRLDSDEADAALLRKTVDELARDEQVRANLDQLQRRLRSYGGPVAAADAVEAHLDSTMD